MQAAAVADGIVCWPRSPLERAQDAVRYAGVLAVWLALALVRPRLALDIFVNRRSDSPIPRRRRTGGGRALALHRQAPIRREKFAA